VEKLTPSAPARQLAGGGGKKGIAGRIIDQQWTVEKLLTKTGKRKNRLGKI